MKIFTTLIRQLFLIVFLFSFFSFTLSASVYEKVTSAPSDWSGQYLIVYETGGVAFDGSLSTLDAVSNIKQVTISDNQIMLDDVKDNFYFNIKKDGNMYKIQSASGYYIGHTKDANALSSAKESSFSNFISFVSTTSDVHILASGGCYLRYNANKDQTRFRYYKSESYTNQKAIQLYKLVDDAEEQIYTVTLYNCGSQYGSLEGVSVELPEEGPLPSEECQAEGWEFAGWSDMEIITDVESVVLLGNEYLPKGDCSLYAVYKKVFSFEEQTYTITPISATEVSVSPALPVGVDVSFSNTYSNPYQMTNGNVQTWTITGFDMPLIATSASMKTNKSSGNGSIVITVGKNEVYKLDPYTRNYDHSDVYSDKYFELTSKDKVGTIVVQINATINSLYCRSLTITLGEEEALYNSNPICASIDEYIVTFGDVNLETNKGRIVNIPDLPEVCNPLYSTKVGWTTTSIFGMTSLQPQIIDENTIFTQNTQLYPVYSRNCETEMEVWKLVTDVSTLVVSDTIVIVAKNYDYALSTTQNTNNRAQAPIVRSSDYIAFDDNVQKIILKEGLVSGSFAFYTGSDYLYAASSTSNHLKTQDEIKENGSWLIEILDSVATIKASNVSHNWLRYNAINNPPIFSCYASGQEDVSIYKKTIITTMDPEYYICGNLIVESGELFESGEDLFFNMLTIKSSLDDAGQIVVDENVELKVNQVVVEKTIDASRWFFFSVPFDCNIADNVEAYDVETKNQLNYSTNYVIYYYDQVKASENKGVIGSKAWVRISDVNTTLVANRGYIIGYLVDEGQAIIKFKSREAQTISAPETTTLNFGNDYIWHTAGEVETANGWNLIGLPYYQNVNASLTPRYVTIPNDDGKTYKQEEIFRGDNIAPFIGFFVQTEASPIFSMDMMQHAASLQGIVGLEQELDKAVITFSDANGGEDKTTIINNPNSTSDYEIGSDLVKWIGYANIPQIYSIQGDDILAFNSLAIDNSTIVSIGVYAPVSGEYIFALDNNSIGNLQVLTLYDKETGRTTFLVDDSYIIYLEKGVYEGRFELRMQQRIVTNATTINEDMIVWIVGGVLNIDNIPLGADVYVYDAVGRIIDVVNSASETFRYDFSMRGVYNIVIRTANNMIVFKTIY